MKSCLIILTLLLSMTSWANCDAVKTAETLKYEQTKAHVDKQISPVVEKVRSFLKTITPSERALILKGADSAHLPQLSQRATEEMNKYGADSNHCPKTYTYNGNGKCIAYEKRVAKYHTLTEGTHKSFVYYFEDNKLFIEVKHDIISKDNVDEYALTVDVSNTIQEELTILDQVALYYPAPDLDQYLKMKMPAVCQTKAAIPL